MCVLHITLMMFPPIYTQHNHVHADASQKEGCRKARSVVTDYEAKIHVANTAR